MKPTEPSRDPLRSADGRLVNSADDVLPPVQAPSPGFLLQLFFIPLIIVVIIVAVWGMFSWLVQLGSNPRDLVSGIRKQNDSSWHKAYLLADYLRNPEYDHLKEDTGLARELAALLQDEIKAASMNEKRLLLRVYLCRVLGEFRVPDVIPALVNAARTERQTEEVDVRRAAAEGMAVLADQMKADELRDRQDVLDVLLEMATERGETAEDTPVRDELRSAAAYALGVIGGDTALDQLERMLGDAHANTRYNAATGLARHGDPRAQNVLIEMLDPGNTESKKMGATDSERLQKKYEVLLAGIAAAVRMAQAPVDTNLTPLKTSLQQLADSDLPRKIRLQARECLLAIEQERR